MRQVVAKRAEISASWITTHSPQLTKGGRDGMALCGTSWHAVAISALDILHHVVIVMEVVTPFDKSSQLENRPVDLHDKARHRSMEHTL